MTGTPAPGPTAAIDTPTAASTGAADTPAPGFAAVSGTPAPDPAAAGNGPAAGSAAAADMPASDFTAVLETPAPGSSEIVRTTAPDPTEDADAPLPAGGQGRSSSILIYDRPAADRLLEELAAAGNEAPEWFSLRAEAERLALVQGFEQLISLNANNIDEFPHQVDAARTALQQMRGRALLADEVGLGKTIEAGIILKELMMRGLARKILILTPASLCEQWRLELESKFLVRFAVNRDPDGWAAQDRVIASIDTAKRPEHVAKLVDLYFDLVIVDEAHSLRNRNTDAWRLVNTLKRRYLLLLTATPIHNDLSELYSLVTLLKPGLLRTYREFRRRFVDRKDPRQPVNAARLKALLAEVMVRHTHGHVSVRLPPRNVYTYPVKLGPEERDLYQRVTAFVRARARAQADRLALVLLQQEICSSPPAAAGTLERLAARAGAGLEDAAALAEAARSLRTAAKADAAVRVIREAGEKVILFTAFTATRDLLLARLAAEGIDAVGFSGSLTPAQKEGAIRCFRDEAQVLVSTEAGGEGRNLQFCRVMVNYDLPWNPMLVEQRIGRIHRIGQTQPVYVFNFASEGTIEAYLLDLLANKLRMFELVVGETSLVLGNLRSGESFEAILRRICLEAPDEAAVQERLESFGEELQQARDKFASIKEAQLIVSRLFESEGKA